MKFTLMILDNVSTLNWLIMKSKFAIFVEISYGNENMTQTTDIVPYKQFPVIQTFEYNSEIDNVDPNQSLTFSYGLSQNAIPYELQKENQTLRRSLIITNTSEKILFQLTKK